ncbi:Uncharacterised protein [Pseudomonas fluorescens]|uniref:DUF4760 domain-containing protein n=1 Tax=Pseudomonas fluorescens TaxID=294 RepID=A0A3S4PFY0_PSEFL|nr:hypothetical protein [Pseudomonas fluorescens]VEF10872.1 Uncharacterised protein [Pseudomonas fluorescens]
MSHTQPSRANDQTLTWLAAGILVTILCGIGAVWLGTSEANRLAKVVEVSAAMLAASGVILSTYLSVKQSKEMLRRLEEERLRADAIRDQQKSLDRQEETFRLIEKWDDPHFLEARKFSRQLGKELANLTPQALVARVNDDTALRSSVGLMLNYFDFIRLSIKHDRVDVNLIKLQLAPIALATLDRFGAWINTQDLVWRNDVAEFRKLVM